MDDGVSLRKATLGDLSAIISIYKNAIEAMENNGIHQWDDVYPSAGLLKGDINNDEMYVVKINSEIASIFVLNQDYEVEYQKTDWQYKGATFFVIHRLCVNPVLQGKGVAKMTMDLIENMLRHKGIETIRLDAFSQNPAALKLYEGRGYKKVGEVKWRKGLFFLYEKKL